MSNNDINNSFAVLTMSDKGSQGKREDTSGEYLQKTLVKEGYVLTEYRIIPDIEDTIVENLIDLVDNKKISLIVTTGGTGLSPSDVTPEAMIRVLDKEIPGMAEAMRNASLAKTSRAMLSRGKAGVRKDSLIINLPGSLKAVRENLEVVLEVIPHAMEKIQGGTSDCGAL
ncbi:MAG: MogA/MoaB family molybdenum cofactor biosynthesis protein [Desulfobulbaceae bacterium]|nr:MogA/MoaB family molybdenum cofactor biosynthesis protein [Desulfobulbaceae bacterium]